jgi:hypothetical protein
MRARKRLRKRQRSDGGAARGARNKRDAKIVLDERAQQQPADRETAQRSGRPSK